MPPDEAPLDSVLRDLLLASSLGPVSSPFSICSSEAATTPRKQYPLGIVTRDAFPSAVFSEAHISSYGSRVDGGASHRPRELAGTRPRLLEPSCASPLFSPLGSKQPLMRKETEFLRGWGSHL